MREAGDCFGLLGRGADWQSNRRLLRFQRLDGSHDETETLNKVAANVTIGRSMGGVHWRTDYTETLQLGEAMAIGLLESSATTKRTILSLTKFDGISISL